jgi:hypothetical protein
VLVVANFDRHQALEASVHLPPEVIAALALETDKALLLTNLLSGEAFGVPALREGIRIRLAPSDACMLSF